MKSNVLAFFGVHAQHEICAWICIGVFMSFFDGTIFRLNTDLSAIWSVQMPKALPLPMQSAFRTVMSGVVITRGLTLHLYLGTLVILLYPLLVEDHPYLILPWLIVCAIRRILCELVTLCIGLLLCLILGPTQIPCIMFLLFRIANLGPAFYLFLLVYNYYKNLFMATAVCVRPEYTDYGFEQAVRRRRTKSLQSEEKLRKLLNDFYSQRLFTNLEKDKIAIERKHVETADVVTQTTSNMTLRSITGACQSSGIPFCNSALDSTTHISVLSNKTSRRGADCIIDQFVDLGLRVAAYLNDGQTINSQTLEVTNYGETESTETEDILPFRQEAGNDVETPPCVGTSGTSRRPSYQTEYPDIFMKKSEVPKVEIAKEASVCGELLKKKVQLQPKDGTGLPQAQRKKFVRESDFKNCVDCCKNRKVERKKCAMCVCKKPKKVRKREPSNTKINKDEESPPSQLFLFDLLYKNILKKKIRVKTVQSTKILPCTVSKVEL